MKSSHVRVINLLVIGVAMALSVSVKAAGMSGDSGMTMQGTPESTSETAGPRSATTPGSTTGAMSDRKRTQGTNSMQDQSGMSSTTTPKSANETAGSMERNLRSESMKDRRGMSPTGDTASSRADAMRDKRGSMQPGPRGASELAGQSSTTPR